ncbi:hypothetical protein QJS10_CPB17g01031 [Acorus calamus]|uniref:Uncharacterized protein n=1 Tax=Acorus calamus TaxID=4465 RepID=A0AAV9CZE1_ACOCL|nr:hypothetical protein QJS10_CPB17g01031 [Acorus calamus]
MTNGILKTLEERTTMTSEPITMSARLKALEEPTDGEAFTRVNPWLPDEEGHKVGGDLEEGHCSGAIRSSVQLDRPIPSAED